MSAFETHYWSIKCGFCGAVAHRSADKETSEWSAKQFGWVVGEFNVCNFCASGERCPDCNSILIPGPGGGVKCSSSTCSYWFCY